MSSIDRYSPEQLAAEQSRFMSKVYLWMAFGLFTTAYASYMTANSEALLSLIFSNKLIFYGLIIGELALVISFTALIRKISAPVALVMFFLYAMLNGLTFSEIFIVYTQQSIASSFGVTAGMFLGLSAYGFLTKRDLSAMGALMVSALLGLILAMVVNLFLHNSTLDWLTSIAGVFIFSGLIAYDTQKIKAMNLMGEAADQTKVAVYGALTLYLDFINLFLSLLRFSGRRR